MTLGARVALQQAEKILVKSAGDLRARLEAGDHSVQSEFCEVVRTLALIAPAVAPGNGGELLTTGELAERLGITAKTLLRRKAKKQIKPVIERGKFLRWGPGQSL